MRRLCAAGLATVLLTALAVTFGGSALAYFSSSGSGSASAAVTKLTAPTISVATPAAGGTVALTWGAVTPPGAGSVTYYVTRDGGDPAGTCPIDTAPATVVTCKDSGVPVGEHVYRVTALWETWTAIGGSKTAKVTVGETTKFTISGSTAAPAAGGSVNLTITAKDGNNSTVTTYTGSHSLVFSGASSSPGNNAPTVANSSGTAIAFDTATALTFTAGVATVSSTKNGVLKIYNVGPASVTATEGSLTTPTPLALTVSPAAASKYVLDAASPTLDAGDTDQLTITAQDAYGNTATSYTGSHNLVFSGASASSGGNAPTVTNSSGAAISFGAATAIKFTAGIAVEAEADGGVMKLFKSGSTSVKATEGSIVTPTAVTVTVSPVAASKYALAAASATPAAGGTDNLTITAQDTYGNTAISYTGSHDLVFSGASASPGGNTPTVTNSSGAEIEFGTATAIEFGAGVAVAAEADGGVMKLFKSGSTSVKATEGSIVTPTAVTVTVAPGAAAKFVLTSSTPTPVAAANFNLTITAQDAYANTATAYTGSKSITFSGASASPSGALPTVVNSGGTVVNFGSATALTFSLGAAAVASSKNGVAKLNKAGETNISATDGTLTTPTPLAVTVSTGAAAKLAFSEPTVSAGSIGSPCLFTCAITSLGNSGTVKARILVTDGAGNTVSGVGAGKTVNVTVTAGGTISGSPLSIVATGIAVSTGQFTYTAPASGAFTHTITAASTGYTSATATASK